MKTIRVGFSCSKRWTPLSWAIRKQMGVNYDHTYIVAGGDVYESTIPKVRKLSCLDWLETHDVILEVEVEISDKRWLEVKSFLLESIGKGYSIRQLINILFNRDRDNGSTKYICSELVARALSKELCITETKLDLITPLDIYNRVQKYITNGASCNS